MGKFAYYLENALINHFFRNVSYTPPTNLYLALYNSIQTDYDSAAEVTGGGYTRMLLPSFDVDYTTSSASMAASVIFPLSTSSWGNIHSWGIRDSSQGGNLLFYGSFDTIVPVSSGQNYMVFEDKTKITLLGTTRGGWAQYSAYSVLNWILNKVTFIGAENGIYAALGKDMTLPSSGVFSDSWTELSAFDYGRRQIRSSDGTGWKTPTDGSTYNLNDVVYTTSATEDWGLIEGIVLYTYNDKSLFWGNLSTSISVSKGDGFKISAQSLKFYIS